MKSNTVPTLSAGTNEQPAALKSRKVTLFVAALATALTALLVSTATSASASAYGCTGYGTGVSWQGVYVRNGTWCGSVVGSGTYVNYVGGNFYNHIPGINNVCNFRERAEFYTSTGAYWGSVTSPTYYRCSAASDLPNLYLNRYVPQGYVLLKLQSNGGTVATISESIH
jgi:hypothetical protein